ncbi:flagellar biosynthetic protein FliO [Marinisporobacter balticus]|uniref:flagellar biosynthetic protein FliO n=1 Tax=Marinisporobacter balticus TaxID=2018667 RepID=UPI0014050142|nr:flagellar biosynthetic protein FliO [Marinisporobacter balticus]
MTKWMGKNGNLFIKGRNMKIVEKISLGMDKSICMIHIGRDYYILAVGKQNIELLDKINQNDIKITLNPPKDEQIQEPFDDFLDEYLYKENSLSDERQKNIDSFTAPMWDKLKGMKRRSAEIKHYKDKDELK